MHKEESPSEDELRLALRRVEPSSHFAAGVLARLAGQTGEQTPNLVSGPDQESRSRWFFAGFSPALAAVLLLMLLLPLGSYLHRRHQQTQAEAAARQFSLAMRLTHTALVNAGQQVAGHGHARDADE